MFDSDKISNQKSYMVFLRLRRGGLMARQFDCSGFLSFLPGFSCGKVKVVQIEKTTASVARRVSDFIRFPFS
jgi:hypothetical protein